MYSAFNIKRLESYGFAKVYLLINLRNPRLESVSICVNLCLSVSEKSPCKSAQSAVDKKTVSSVAEICKTNPISKTPK